MKKFLRPKYLPLYVTAAALVGMLLRIWTFGDGPDKAGLYAPQPLAWTLLWIVTALTLGAVILLSQPLKVSGPYKAEFPQSLPAAIGALPAAFVLMLSSLKILTASSGNLMALLTGLTGVVAAMALLLVAFGRYQGKQPSFPVHILICLHLSIRVFYQSRTWGNEPQIGTILLPFLASICVMLATYHLSRFDVNLGSRRMCVFWNLSAVYFNILAMPHSDEWLFHGAMAVWMMTSLCSLRPRKPAPSTELDQSEDTPQ